MEGLGVAASVIAVVELSAKVASRLLEYSRKVKNAKKDIERLRNAVNSTAEMLRALDTLLRTPGKTLPAAEQLGGALRDCLMLMKKLDVKLGPGKVRKRDVFRSLTWPFESGEVEKAMSDLEPIKTTISLALQVDQTNIVLAVRRKLDFGKLAIAKGAEFDSHLDEHDPKCLPDTRVDLLEEITQWAEDKSGSCIFWLNGMAGTGKSTISRTVAQYFADRGRLGASFFFKRGGGDRSHAARFFTTIAAQLAHKIPGLGLLVEEAIDTDPSISEKALRQQFDKLIVNPLSKLQHLSEQDSLVVLVIDALDECERQSDIRTILVLLSELRDVKSISVRVFITSRPELPIRLRFRNMNSDTYKDIVLHEISQSTIEHDISVFLHHEFQEIREERSMLSNWPGEQAIQTLVKMAAPLFIFAATICLFIRDQNWDPKKRLDIILEYKVASQASKLDMTYLPILDQLLVGQDENEKEILTREFQEIVGAIVVLANPLSSGSLANLLGISEDTIDCRLGQLHSVLSIPTDKTSSIRLLHISFREFLLDPQKRGKNPLWVDETKTHEMVATRCMELLSNWLKKDMCDIQKPGILRSEIDDHSVGVCLSAEVQYACRYWVHHLEKSTNLFAEEQVYTFLQNHLLHWLEAMSLLKNSPESVRMIMSLETNLEASANPDLRAFLYDSRRFAVHSAYIFEKSPLEVYSSALLFTPRNSLVRGQFEKDIPTWITRKPNVHEDWDACLLVRGTSHAYIPVPLQISPDGKQIAHGSHSNIEIWDSGTGTLLQILQGRDGIVWNIAISPDGKFLASSTDYHVLLWDHSLGVALHTIECEEPCRLVFSPDSKVLVVITRFANVSFWDVSSGMNIGTQCPPSVRGMSTGDRLAQPGSTRGDSVVFTDIVTGREIELFTSPPRPMRTVVSPDGKCVVCTDRIEGGLWFWNISLGTQQKPKDHFEMPQRPLGDISAIVFSPDGNRVAAGSDSAQILVWDTTTGALLHTLVGHSDLVRRLAFSPDGMQILSSSNDETIRLWDIGRRRPGSAALKVPASTIAKQWGHVHGLEFLLDGRKVISHTSTAVHVWDSATRDLMQIAEISRTHYMRSIAISPNSRRIAFILSERRRREQVTVEVWDVALDESLQYSCSIVAPLDMGKPMLGSFAFWPDGEKVMCSWDDKMVRLLDIGTGTWRPLVEHLGHDPPVLSSDGKRILVASEKGAQLWDVASRLLLRSFDVGARLTLPRVRLSPDNKWVVVSSFGGGGTTVLRVFDIDGGAVLHTLQAPGSCANSSVFLPDGSLDLGLHVSDGWVMDGLKRLLWLPPGHRPAQEASSGRVIALAEESGRVSILQFDQRSKIP